MGMRINQNVLSQSTYANLTQANNRLESSINKLSSGLRINSASDDAAGLAISEKMRRQIKGLSRAKLNAQDGISMIQSAEGALNETQSAIQRMRELALQSANDTLTSNDRLEIQKEVEELKKQIDTIASSTEFNTKKLLNGNQSALVSSSSEAVNGLITGRVASNGDYDLSFTTVSGGVSQIQTSQILKNKDTGDLAKGSDKLKDISSLYASSGEFALQNPQTITLTGNGKSASLTLDGQMTLNEVAASIQNAMTSDSGLGIKNSSVKVQLDSSNETTGVMKITSGMVGDQGEFNIAGSQDVLDALGFATSREAANSMVRVTMSDAYGNSNSISTSSDKASGLLEGMDVQFKSQAAFIAGQGGIVNGLKYTNAQTLTISAVGYKASGVSVAVGVSIQLSGTYSMEGIADIINYKIKAAADGVSAVVTGLEASVVDGEIRISYNLPNREDTSFKIGGTGDNLGIQAGTYNGFVIGEKNKDNAVQGISMLTKVTADATKAVVLNVGGQTNAGVNAISITYNVASALTSGDLKEINELVANANAALATAGARVDVVNGSLVFTSEQVGTNANDSKSKLVLGITDTTTNSAGSNALGLKGATTYGSGDSEVKMHVVDTSSQFQIGADAGDNMKIGIADMGTEALGLDKIDLTSVKGAEKSLERINQALDKVSAERSKLGAYQNRLNYTISNLTNTSTNLTSAESRIRDVDVASEMMEFTRNQIVTQAATSMLAQANALPQNALSLLG